MSDDAYRILIIEDCVEDRAAYRRHIARGREQKYQFWETGSAVDGLRMCREISPDCILLDYQLTDLNGLEFLDLFHSEFGETQVSIVMLTGHGNEAVAVQALKKGVEDYLIKGLNSENVAPVVQSAIQKTVLRRQLVEQQRAVDSLSRERVRLISELTKHAAALSEANQRKDEFLAMLAHELRNPLAPIRTGLQIMSMRHDASTVDSVRAMIERQVQHLARLVDDLLDVSRVTHGKIQLHPERVNLASIAARAVESCQDSITRRQHQLTLSFPPAPLEVHGDPVRLEQIVSNLLNNAAKYTPVRGQIWLTGRREGNETVLSVRDTGIGISPELLPRVFDMFIQGDNSLARDQGGLGIGLTLVQLLVKLHGGTVDVQSSGLGQGSEFAVRLPAAATVPAPQQPTCAPPPKKPASLRMLVVDDNIDAANSLAMLLRISGHDVRVDHSGRSALETMESFQPQAVLLDIGMPGMNGYEVAECIRSTAATQPLLIAVTGYGQQNDSEQSRAAGFDHHLVKPVDLADLQELLAAVPR